MSMFHYSSRWPCSFYFFERYARGHQRTQIFTQQRLLEIGVCKPQTIILFFKTHLSNHLRIADCGRKLSKIQRVHEIQPKAPSKIQIFESSITVPVHAKYVFCSVQRYNDLERWESAPSSRVSTEIEK